MKEHVQRAAKTKVVLRNLVRVISTQFRVPWIPFCNWKPPSLNQVTRGLQQLRCHSRFSMLRRNNKAGYRAHPIAGINYRLLQVPRINIASPRGDIAPANDLPPCFCISQQARRLPLLDGLLAGGPVFRPLVTRGIDFVFSTRIVVETAVTPSPPRVIFESKKSIIVVDFIEEAEIIGD